MILSLVRLFFCLNTLWTEHLHLNSHSIKLLTRTIPTFQAEIQFQIFGAFYDAEHLKTCFYVEISVDAHQLWLIDERVRQTLLGGKISLAKNVLILRLENLSSCLMANFK